jgi:hypothetical protein
MRSGMKSKKELSYSDLLKDSRWQEKRLRVFERDHWCCCECHRPARAGGISLNAHHRFYNKLIKQAKVNNLTTPPVAIILPGTGSTVWEQMRAAANGLVALQEMRNAE